MEASWDQGEERSKPTRAFEVAVKEEKGARRER